MQSSCDIGQSGVLPMFRIKKPFQEKRVPFRKQLVAIAQLSLGFAIVAILSSGTSTSCAVEETFDNQQKDSRPINCSCARANEHQHENRRYSHVHQSHSKPLNPNVTECLAMGNMGNAFGHEVLKL